MDLPVTQKNDYRFGTLFRWMVVSFLALSFLGLASLAKAATTVTTTTSFDYDLATGLLKKTIVEPGDSNLCLVTEYALDAYGHPTASTTRNCNGTAAIATGALSEAASPSGDAVFDPRTLSTEYSTDQRFALKTTSVLTTGKYAQYPLQLIETRTYDSRFGTLATSKGPNQLTTSWTYDGLGRRTLETRPDGTQTKWTYVFCTNPSDPSWPSTPVGATTASCDPVAGDSNIGTSSIKPVYYVQAMPLKTDGVTPNGPYARVYYDSLGREIRTETQGFDGESASRAIYQDTAYNRAGYASVKWAPNIPGVTSPVYSAGYTYDTLGRVTRMFELQTAAGSASTWTSYSGLSITVTDPKGYQTTQVSNVAGQIARIIDGKGGTLLRSYDPLGNLVQTTDPKGNVISMAYDIRGRKTAMYDPDMGVWTYAYNAAGELVKQTDANLKVSRQGYDQIGRMVSRTEPDLTSAWSYDMYADGSTCTNGLGKLCEATADNGYDRKQYYDAKGRPSSVATYVNSKTYTTSIVYDETTGRTSTQTYPTGVQVNSTYTSLGYLWKLTDARNGIALWTAKSLDAQGHLLQFAHGNDLVTTNTYFADGRINTTKTGSGDSVQSLLYGYDLNRNINARLDVGTGVTATYTYDELNRLTSESRTGGGVGSTAQVIGWAYDAIGNMTARTESGTTNTYNYNASGAGSSRPHAVGSVSGLVNGVPAPIYRYDDNGNLTSGAGRTLTWTSANMVKDLTAGATKLSFYYGPEHDRVMETYSRAGAPQRTTVYLNPGAGAGLFYEEDCGVAGTKMKHYISAGGSTVAAIVCTATPCTNTANSSTQYWHEDHLGSVSVITSQTQAVLERMAYEPFGKRRNSNGVTDQNGTLAPASTDRGFTEQEHMDEVGLINMNGRIYDPALGRFMSADPTVPYPNSTQSYNRYSYVRNNPLRMLDPSGFTDEDFGDNTCLSCDVPSIGTQLPYLGGAGGFSTLPGDLSCFSCGNASDPLASYGFDRQLAPLGTVGVIPWGQSLSDGTPTAIGAVMVTGSAAQMSAQDGSADRCSGGVCLDQRTGEARPEMVDDNLRNAGRAYLGAQFSGGWNGAREFADWYSRFTFTVLSFGEPEVAPLFIERQIAVPLLQKGVTNPEVAKLLFPKIAGYTPEALGRLIGWGSGPAESEARILTVTAREVGVMEQQGLTREGAARVRDFYANDFARNAKNATAEARVALMDKIMKWMD